MFYIQCNRWITRNCSAKTSPAVPQTVFIASFNVLIAKPISVHMHINSQARAARLSIDIDNAEVKQSANRLFTFPTASSILFQSEHFLWIQMYWEQIHLYQYSPLLPTSRGVILFTSLCCGFGVFS